MLPSSQSRSCVWLRHSRSVVPVVTRLVLLVSGGGRGNSGNFFRQRYEFNSPKVAGPQSRVILLKSYYTASPRTAEGIINPPRCPLFEGLLGLFIPSASIFGPKKLPRMLGVRFVHSTQRIQTTCSLSFLKTLRASRKSVTVILPFLTHPSPLVRVESPSTGI